jgi:hypothetical protein
MCVAYQTPRKSIRGPLVKASEIFLVIRIGGKNSGGDSRYPGRLVSNRVNNMEREEGDTNHVYVPRSSPVKYFLYATGIWVASSGGSRPCYILFKKNFRIPSSMSCAYTSARGIVRGEEEGG